MSRSELTEKEKKSDTNSLVISSTDIEKVLKVKCKKHPKRDAEIIYLVPGVVNQRICSLCAKKDNIAYGDCLDIKEILTSSNESELYSYPVLADPELNEKI